MSKDGGFFDVVKSGLHAVGVDLSTGEEQAVTPEIPVVPKAAHQQPQLHSSAPHGPVPLPSVVHSVNPDVVESKAQERFDKELPDVLAAGTSKYQSFITVKAEMKELLAESLSDAALEIGAVRAALKKLKFTQDDVHAAVTAMRAKREDLKKSFSVNLQAARVDKIEVPTKQIDQTLKQIEAIEQQVADLQQRAADLKAGIQPIKDGIAASEQKLAQAQVIDDAAGIKVDDYLANLEQDLLAKLPK